MFGRVAAALLFTAVQASAQCNLVPVASAQFRGSQLDLSIDGFDLWTATSYGVTLYDRHFDPPQPVASVAIPGVTRVVRAANGTAFAGSSDRIVTVRKSGRSLRIAGSVAAGGTVNDLLLTTNFLYAATSNGLFQFDLLDPANPAKTPAVLPTSSPNVLSLALSGTSLYAADGDSTVEVINVSFASLPQRIGSFTGRPRSTSIRASGGRLFVSDGSQTDIFLGSDVNVVLATSTPGAFGASALAEPQPNLVFTAGPDRRLHALDVTLAGTPVELFTADLPASGGTVNRIGAIGAAAGRVYVAAGDIGLLDYDTTAFAAPFPLRSYPFEATTSIASDGDAALYLSRASGGITRFTQRNGVLTETVSWDRSRPDVVQDVNGSFLLSSSGATATIWNVAGSGIPATAGAATFPKNIRSAVLLGTTAYAVLDNRTLWSADLGQQTPAPQQVTLAAAPSFIVRSGSGVAIADLEDDLHVTHVLYFTSLSSPPQAATLSGIATAGIALAGSTAAVVTFNGITLIDFAAGGAQAVIPLSNGVIARRLAMRGTRLAELTDTDVLLWDTRLGRSLGRFTLPADAVAADLTSDGGVTGVATSSGASTILLTTPSQQPALVASTNGNAFFKKVLATAGHVYLFDGQQVDVFTSRLEYRTGIRPVGLVDAAAVNGALFTITSAFILSSYNADGALLGSAALPQPGDGRPLSLSSVAGALWLSLERGCFSGACEQRTLIFDPRIGVTQTSEWSGAVREVVVNGTRAYALLDTPNEIRVYDVADPFHPRQLVARAAEGSRPAIAIAYSGGTVYVLGDKLYAYNEGDLSKAGEQLSTYVADPASPVTYVDQHLRIDGNCAAMTGRAFSPQLFTVASPASWTSAAPFSSPSPARWIASVPGTMYVLTDHSLEIFAPQPVPPPARHRAAQ
jgi:hypothetical protein